MKTQEINKKGDCKQPFLGEVKAMDRERNDFQTWFVNPMQQLRKIEHAENVGFIFAMVGFPLLERYLREKSKTYERVGLTPDFYSELEIIFPEIKGRGRDFYSAYRHGLLHQVTFSRKKGKKGIWVELPKSAMTSHDERPIYIHENGSFYMNPFVFYDRVVAIIHNDFKIYLGASSKHHGLPAYENLSTAIPGVMATVSQRE